MLVCIIACLVVGYICGCFSSGYFVGKANNVDIRSEGSGNAGTTNALRTMGIKAAGLTFLGDVLKVIIPILIVRCFAIGGEHGWRLCALYAGLGTVLGHNFPFWLGFKGGKGIAVTAGAILTICDWRITLGILVVFVIIVAITRYVSLGSLVAVWSIAVDIILFSREEQLFVHMLIIALLYVILAYYKHWDNIKRLLAGTERKIGEKKA